MGDRVPTTDDRAVAGRRFLADLLQGLRRPSEPPTSACWTWEALGRQLRRTLCSRDARYEALLERAPLAMCLLDASLRIVEVNPVARRSFGDVPELVGRGMDELAHALWIQEHADALVGTIRRVLETGESVHEPEVSALRRDRGVVEHYERQADRITLVDGSHGVVCYFRDASEQVGLREALREAERRKDEFLAMLAHELRNPLAPIRTSAGILRARGTADPLVIRCRDVIERQAAHLTRLLDDLLDASRLTRGKLTLQRTRVRLQEVLDAAIETCRPLIDRQGHRLAVDAAGSDVLLDGDPARLTQVFANLLDNAAKYSDPGGRIDVTVARERDRAVVRVRDRGIGIAPELQRRMFDLFVQGEARGHGPGGLGLGLALARLLVEMHDGTITVASDGAGRGSELTVTLPSVAAASGATAWEREGLVPVLRDGRSEPAYP